MATDEVSHGYPPSAEQSAADAISVRGVSIAILTGGVALYVLREGADLFIPIALGVLLGYILEPPVAALVRGGLPRVVAAGLVYVVIGIAAFGGARSARDQTLAFLQDVPYTIAAIERLDDRRQSANGRLLDRIQSEARALHETLLRRVPPPEPGVVRVMPVKRFHVDDYLQHIGRGAVTVTIHAAAVALLTFLLLATGDIWKLKMVKIAGPTFARRKLTVEVLRTIDRQIGRFFIVRLLISVLVATATALPLWWLGLSHAAVWGAIAGALNILPFLGSATAVGLIAVAAFVQFQTLGMTAAAGAIATAVAILEGNLVSPWLTGRACELNTVAVFVSVLFWGWMWGVWGLLLAIPLMVAIKAAADHVEPLQPLGELLGQ
jgi:predicted PurR-regulated permease PerM